MVKVCRSGATLQDVKDLISEVNLQMEEVKVVLMHIGTCQWTSDKEIQVEPADTMYRDYVEALNECSTAYPKAEIIISSIIPRLPTVSSSLHQSQINREVGKVNEQLKELSREESHISYIDNDCDLQKDTVVCRDAYNPADKTGVHLNKKGLGLLSGKFTECIKTAYYKASLKGEWKVNI